MPSSAGAGAGSGRQRFAVALDHPVHGDLHLCRALPPMGVETIAEQSQDDRARTPSAHRLLVPAVEPPAAGRRRVFGRIGPALLLLAEEVARDAGFLRDPAGDRLVVGAADRPWAQLWGGVPRMDHGRVDGGDGRGRKVQEPEPEAQRDQRAARGQIDRMLQIGQSPAPRLRTAPDGFCGAAAQKERARLGGTAAASRTARAATSARPGAAAPRPGLVRSRGRRCAAAARAARFRPPTAPAARRRSSGCPCRRRRGGWCRDRAGIRRGAERPFRHGWPSRGRRGAGCRRGSSGRSALPRASCAGTSPERARTSAAPLRWRRAAASGHRARAPGRRGTRRAHGSH